MQEVRRVATKAGGSLYNEFQDALNVAGEVLAQGPIARYDGTAGCVCLVYLREAVEISNVG